MMITPTSASANASGNQRSNQSDKRRPDAASQEPAGAFSSVFTGRIVSIQLPLLLIYRFRLTYCSGFVGTPEILGRLRRYRNLNLNFCNDATVPEFPELALKPLQTRPPCYNGEQHEIAA